MHKLSLKKKRCQENRKLQKKFHRLTLHKGETEFEKWIWGLNSRAEKFKSVPNVSQQFPVILQGPSLIISYLLLMEISKAQWWIAQKAQ